MEVKAPVESLVHITEAGADHIRSMLTEQPENAGKNLRIYVEDGGCSGMQYGMVFDEKRPDDFTVDAFGLSVLIDRFSADYLNGAVIDYLDGLNNAGFKISNPTARHTCGCGKSFEA